MNHELGNRVKLLLDILPYLSTEQNIAIKGGTAINMFYRDFPRVSVDIDLVYIPVVSREETLSGIDVTLRKLAATIRKNRPGIGIFPKKFGNEQYVGLTIEENGLIVKIEPNTILRGSVFPSEIRELKKSVINVIGFEGYVKTQVLSLEDLYGGKICAALDRQHPRDLFDIMILFENEGLTSSILKAFVIYLAGHDRPMSELLVPQRKNMQDVFQKEFAGMTDRRVTWEELSDVRERLLREIHSKLSISERLFLVSMKRGEPKWELLNVPGVEFLPSLKWKLLNIRKMNKEKHAIMLEKLMQVLAL